MNRQNLPKTYTFDFLVTKRNIVSKKSIQAYFVIFIFWEFQKYFLLKPKKSNIYWALTMCQVFAEWFSCFSSSAFPNNFFEVIFNTVVQPRLRENKWWTLNQIKNRWHNFYLGNLTLQTAYLITDHKIRFLILFWKGREKNK